MSYPPPHPYDAQRWAGRRVGLLGGSFNPPHEGHVRISLSALRALELDFIWWLVTPQNPLKAASTLLPYERRLALCHAMTAQHSRLIVSDIEAQMGVNRSYDTMRLLRKRFQRTGFVWITGMDNALNFHRWYRWRDLLGVVATAHIARPPASSLVTGCPLRHAPRQNHHFPRSAIFADLTPGNSYWLLQENLCHSSSTEIRNSIL